MHTYAILSMKGWISCCLGQDQVNAMRTTIDIDDEQRARLLELAARRGEKGFSRIIREALDLYLRETLENNVKRRAALDLQGALSAGEAKRLEAAVARIRESWR